MNNETFIERNLITALIMLVVALVSWVGVTVVESGKDIASLKKDTQFMHENIADMKIKLANMEEILISRQYTVATADKLSIPLR
jgi:hypothetical protein